MLNLSGEPYKIEHLYYLAPLDNLASIVNRGLLSHNHAHREGHLATDKLDWQCIRADWYRDLPDGIRRRCAEVLVPDTIHPRFIKQVAVRTQETLLALDENIKRRTEIAVRPELYF